MALKDAETFLLFSVQMALGKKLDNKDLQHSSASWNRLRFKIQQD